MLELGSVARAWLAPLDVHGPCKPVPLVMEESRLPTQWSWPSATCKHGDGVTAPENVVTKKERESGSIAQPQAPPVTEVAADTAMPPPAQAPSSRGRSVGIGVRQNSKPSRWRRDKARLESLENKVSEQAQLARELEAEQRRLRLRNIALEHCIASRDWQLDVLTRWQGVKLDTQLHSTTTLAALSRDFVSRASLLMLRLSEPCNTLADQAVLARISEAVAEFFRDMGVAYVLNPGIQFTLIASHLDSAEGASAPRPDARHWEQVARKISITPQQLDEIAACWKQTRDSMEALQAEAATLCQELNLATETNNLWRMMDYSSRLSTLVYKQAMIYRGFSFIIFGRIMPPFHLARAMVHSFPYFLDTREMVLQLLQLNNVNPNQ